MTSKERVNRAVEFKKPDRLPMEFDVFGVSDTVDFGWNRTRVNVPNSGEVIDEWGCVWSRSAMHNMGQVTGNPLENWNNLFSYQFPDPDNPAFYEGMEERSRKIDRDKYIKTQISFVLFERLHMLRDFENLMVDFYEDREKLEALADRVVEFDLRMIENISRRFPGLIDAMRFTDDWGSEQNSFISVELFDEFFKPRYKKIFTACHRTGWHVWLHSCGKITNLVSSFIEAGVDVFNLQQPTLLNIEKFGEKFAGKVCFSSLADIQRTLPFNNAEEIEDEIKQLLKYWTTPEGGFIASDYTDPEAIGVTTAAKEAMFIAFNKHDPFRNVVK